MKRETWLANDCKVWLQEICYETTNLDEFRMGCFLLKLVMEKLRMDKKMAKVTKEMKVAEKDVKKGKPKAAVKSLKKAEKKNVKLTKIDREERDPFIKKAKKMLKKKGAK